MPRRRRQREHETLKTISRSLISRSKTSIARSRFFIHFFAVAAQPRQKVIKMPNFAFYRGRRKATTKAFVRVGSLESISEWRVSARVQVALQIESTGLILLRRPAYRPCILRIWVCRGFD